jgi:predicted MPP superfamily phosphohydrolase
MSVVPEALPPSAREVLERLPGLPAPRDGKPIKILQITDMHYFDVHHESFEGPRNIVPIGKFAEGDELKPEVDCDGRGCSYNTERGIAVLERLLDATQPTLVVMTGDMIDGRMVKDFRSAMAAILAPIQKRDIPWGFTLGK